MEEATRRQLKFALPVACLLAVAFSLRLAIVLTLRGKPFIAEGALGLAVLQVTAGVAGLAFLFEAARRLAGYRVAIAVLAAAALYRTTAFYDAVPGTTFLGPLLIEATLLAGALALQRKSWVLWTMAAAIVVSAAIALVPWKELGPDLYAGNNPDNWTGRYQPPPFGSSPEDFRHEAERRQGTHGITEGASSAFWFGEALQSMKYDVWGFLHATFRRAMLLTNDWEAPDGFDLAFMRRFSGALALPWLTFGLVVWPLAAAGLYLSWIERRRHVLAYVLLALVLLLVLFSFVTSANRLPAMPVLFFFAGYAVAKWIEMRRWQMRRIPVTAAIVAAVVLVHANLPPSIYGVGDTGSFRRHHELAAWYQRHGEAAQAADEMERAFQLRPEARDDPRFAALAAQCYLAAGNVPRALEFFLRVEDHASAARCYLRLGEPARAADEFAKAAAADPGSADLRLELADAQARARKTQEALDTLAAASASFPSDARPWLAKARLYRDLALWNDAAASAEEALNRDPHLREARAVRDEALRNRPKQSP